MRRSIRILAAALGLAIAGTLTAAPANAHNSGYYSVPYSDTIYRHTHTSTTSYTWAATYAEWSGDGSPAPAAAPVSYVKYPWSSTIYAVSFFGPNRAEWVWNTLTFDQWTRAGRPAAVNATWIQGSVFYKYASNPSEVFVEVPPNPIAHKLTLSEWQAAGSPGPIPLSSQGFYKYPWASEIGHVTDINTGAGYPVSYNYWSEADFPTPQVVSHVNGEEVWKFSFSNQLYLDSPITGCFYPLNYSQWAALGFPAPVLY